MDLLGTMVNAGVVAAVGTVIVWFTKGRSESLDRRIDRLETRLVGTETRLDGRIDRLEGRFDSLQSSMDAMRSDLTRVALAVGVRRRARNG